MIVIDHVPIRVAGAVMLIWQGITDVLTPQMLNDSFLSVFAAVALGLFILVFREFMPRWKKSFDKRDAFIESMQTTNINITAAMSRLDASVNRLSTQIAEYAREKEAWEHHMAAQMSQMQQALAILAASRSSDGDTRCGSKDCPAMKILNRDPQSRTRKTDERITP